MKPEHFTEGNDVEAKRKIEWDGKDFRGEKVYPFTYKYLTAHPLMFEWIRRRPASSMGFAVTVLKPFFEWTKLTPEEWLALDKKKARDLVWGYVSQFIAIHGSKANNTKLFAKSFYLYHNEEPLLFIKGKHDVIYEPTRIKHDMSKEVCWTILRKARHLRDETILTFAYESGLRVNAIAHLNYGHLKQFLWFKIVAEGEVVPSDMEHGGLAIFKVMARENPKFTFDKKLRGKGINWYYGCLHKEATKLLKKFITQYHENSENNTPLFYSLHPFNKNQRLKRSSYLYAIKDCVERSGLPTKEINFHSMRRGFRRVVRNTKEIADAEFKEAIMGHKLKGAQSAYFDKDPIEFAREYSKCDFSSPSPEKDQALMAKEKEIERLRKQMQKYEEAIENAKATTKIEVEPVRPLGPPASRDEIQNAYKDFQENSEQPSKNETITPSKPLSKLEPLYEQYKRGTEEPKAGECLRKIRTFDWTTTCRICRTRQRLDYVKCAAPQKPKSTTQLPMKRW